MIFYYVNVMLYFKNSLSLTLAFDLEFLGQKDIKFKENAAEILVGFQFRKVEDSQVRECFRDFTTCLGQDCVNNER